MSHQISQNKVQAYLEDHAIQLDTALQKQNWYSYNEAIDNLTKLINIIIKKEVQSK